MPLCFLLCCRMLNLLSLFFLIQTILMSLPIDRLYFGGLTKGVTNGSTYNSNKLVLIINQNGADKFHYVSPYDFEKANAVGVNWETVTSNGIIPEELDNSSLRLSMKGDGSWQPLDY